MHNLLGLNGVLRLYHCSKLNCLIEKEGLIHDNQSCEIKKGSVGFNNKQNNISLMKPLIIHSITSALQALKLPLQASNTLSQYQILKTASVQHLTLEY